MDLPRKPKQELDRAKEQIEAMENSESLDDLEHHWALFLHFIERVWNKSQAHFKHLPAWEGWKGQYENMRRRDSLVSYLRHARNADQHSIEEITGRLPGATTIRNSSGEPITIKKLNVTGGGQATYEADGPLDVDFTPSKVKLIPVTNYGTTFNPPTIHHDQPVDPTDVIGIAKTGAAFYEDMLDAAIRKFCRDQ
ncbi:hypothetical protein [Halomonas aquatica]|uniref:Uncharacterized protein n=1 Tax=Halomonas aquatica TaxID=3151123 RepID=A0ABV1NBX2_9GAMM